MYFVMFLMGLLVGGLVATLVTCNYVLRLHDTIQNLKLRGRRPNLTLEDKAKLEAALRRKRALSFYEGKLPSGAIGEP